MAAIVVLGDSLSAKGYGIDDDAATWPQLLQGELGAAATVTVCAKGGLLASVTEATLGGNYFGCSQHLGKALNVDGRAYLICLGTNDVMQATKGFTMKTIEEGLTRIVLQLQHGVSAVFGHEPDVFLVQPPNIIGNIVAERRRLELLLPAFGAIAARTTAKVLPMATLPAERKHRDGVH